MRAALAVLISSLAGPTLASDFSLAFPVDCTLNETCHIQQYMDRDPGPGVRDFTCGSLSYDGHKGTDFAVSTLAEMEAGVNVVAAAPGVVLGTRDGMRDVYFTPDIAADIEGRECGNGVVLDHGNGWITQYCHLKQGSVTVARGERVETGDVLGHIGLSGRTEFPHLHLSVRKDGDEIDPFGPANARACDVPPAGDRSLWADPIAYRPGGILDLGFADAVPAFDEIKAGTADRALTTTSPAFVLFAYAFGSRAGDKLILMVRGPNGTLFDQEMDLDRTQAKLFRASGRRLSDGWMPGQYEGIATLLREDQVIDQKRTAITIPAP